MLNLLNVFFNVVNLNMILVLLIFVEFNIDFIELKDGNGFLRRIELLVIGWIRKVWLLSIVFKFWKESCILFMYVVSFVCFDGLKIVKIFIFFNVGIEKKVRNLWLFIFFFLR